MKQAKSIWDSVADELNQLAAAVSEGGPLPAGFTVRTVLVSGPPVVAAADVKAGRESLRVSQSVFARFLGVSAQTVKAWEQGTRVPTGAVRRLLTDIRRHPDHWAARLREESVAATTPRG